MIQRVMDMRREVTQTETIDENRGRSKRGGIVCRGVDALGRDARNTATHTP